MSVYFIADIKVTDDKWIPAYATSVHDIVHKHGGKYLARSGNVKTLEGKPLETTLIALIEFPSAAAVSGLPRRSQVHALCRGPPRGQQQPHPTDRRYRSGRNDFLSAEGSLKDHSTFGLGR